MLFPVEDCSLASAPNMRGSDGCYLLPALPFQIIEENGVRRVLVLPQQPEFHPGGHSPLHHPPPPPHAHLPAFIPHPAMMPPPPHLYTGMAGGDMSSQYISQYHPAHIYSEQGESEPAVYCYVKLLPRYLICTLSQSTPGSHCYVLFYRSLSLYRFSPPTWTPAVRSQRRQNQQDV